MINVLLGVLIVLSVITLVLRDLLAAVIVSSVFSLVSCLVFFMLQAPDVALTEAAVGTAVGTVVFLWAVFKTERRDTT